MSDPRQQIIDALVAERYAPPLWWKPPPPEQTASVDACLWDDSEATCARRRRHLAADWSRLDSTGEDVAL